MATQNILPMGVDTVPLTTLTPHPDNARKGDTRTIAESLQTHGQYRPLVVQKAPTDDGTHHILCGNNTYLAAQKLGWEQVAVQYVDVDDTQAKKILLVDNKANDEAEYDDQALLALLESLDDLDDLTGTGFEEDALTDLQRTTGVFGDQATGFLDQFAPAPATRNTAPPVPQGPPPPTPTAVPDSGGPAPAPDLGHTPAPGPEAAHHQGVTLPDYVSVSYTITEDERTEIRAAINHAQQRWGTETHSDALVRIMRTYNEENSA